METKTKGKVPAISLLLKCLCTGVGALVVMYVLTCLLSSTYLVLTSSITPEDVAMSSWISSPSTALHFSRGLMFYVTFTIVVMVTMVVSISKKDVPSLIYGILLSLCWALSGTFPVTYEGGIYSDTIKIGCYVWDSKNCQQMIGVNVTSSVEKYNRNDSSRHTPEYRERLSKEVKPTEWMTAIGSMPGGYFLMAPFVIVKRTEVNYKIDSQRKALLDYKLIHQN